MDIAKAWCQGAVHPFRDTRNEHSIRGCSHLTRDQRCKNVRLHPLTSDPLRQSEVATAGDRLGIHGQAYPIVECLESTIHVSSSRGESFGSFSLTTPFQLDEKGR